MGSPKATPRTTSMGLPLCDTKIKKKPFFKGRLSPLLRDEATFDAVYCDLLGTLAGGQGVVEHMPGLCSPSQFVVLARDMTKPKRAFDLYDCIVDQDSKSMQFQPTDCIKVKKNCKFTNLQFYKFNNLINLIIRRKAAPKLKPFWAQRLENGMLSVCRWRNTFTRR